MLKTAVAIRHIQFEDLGTFEGILADAGYNVSYNDLGVHELRNVDPLMTDLLIILGGPVGVYETDVYPFLAKERQVLAARLAANRPTLGICLGAQQIAAALGAQVKTTGIKEIGFSQLSLTAAGHAGPLRHLEGASVLHWHGDAFQTPDMAANLAWTPLCATQAFALGRNVLGVQFHPEVDASNGIERWLVGHAAELSGAGIDPRRLRDEAAEFGPKLRDASRRMLVDWLQQLDE